MSPEQLEALLLQIEQLLERLWKELTAAQRAQLQALYAALQAAIVAARAGGPAAARATLIALVEALQAFIGGLMRIFDDFFLRSQLRWLVSRIHVYLAGMGSAAAGAEAGGTAAGGATVIGGLTVAGLAIVLVEIVAVLLALIIWAVHVKETHKAPPTHVAGPSCGNPMPVATGLTEWDISVGTLNSWENLMAKMRKRAALYPCAGACASGKCTGNPAVMDFDQTRAFLVTHSWARFDVYCECLT
jgi:hypothetical protein